MLIHTTMNDIILNRDNTGHAQASIPQQVVRHSPTGFEWGYGGSGPADLALNILLAVTGKQEIADQYYQDFKCDFIAAMPTQGGKIKHAAVTEWLRHRGVRI